MSDLSYRRGKRYDSKMKTKEYMLRERELNSNSHIRGYRGLYFGDQHWDIEQSDYFTYMFDDEKYIPPLVPQEPEDVAKAINMLKKHKLAKLETGLSSVSKQVNKNIESDPKSSDTQDMTASDSRTKEYLKDKSNYNGIVPSYGLSYIPPTHQVVLSPTPLSSSYSDMNYERENTSVHTHNSLMNTLNNPTNYYSDSVNSGWIDPSIISITQLSNHTRHSHISHKHHHISHINNLINKPTHANNPIGTNNSVIVGDNSNHRNIHSNTNNIHSNTDNLHDNTNNLHSNTNNLHSKNVTVIDLENRDASINIVDGLLSPVDTLMALSQPEVLDSTNDVHSLSVSNGKNVEDIIDLCQDDKDDESDGIRHGDSLNTPITEDVITQLIHKRKSTPHKPIHPDHPVKPDISQSEDKLKMSVDIVDEHSEIMKEFQAFVDAELAEITIKSPVIIPVKEASDTLQKDKSYGVPTFADVDYYMDSRALIPKPPMPLVNTSIHRSRPSRVGVVPSAGIKLSESYLSIPQPVTVSIRPEKRDFDSREERKRKKREHKRLKITSHQHDLSVFSGPRFSPGLYHIQPNPDGKGTYVPDAGQLGDRESGLHNAIARPSQYTRPNVSEYFEAALGDASTLPKYDEYDSRDPINFRHAYRSKSKHSDSKAVVRHSDADHPPRRRHRKAIREVTPEVISDQEEKKYDVIKIRHELLKDISEDEEIEEEMDVDDIIKSEDTSHDMASEEDDIAISLNTDIVDTTDLSLSLVSRFGQCVVPSRNEGISRLKRLGTFLEDWKLNDPEVCCVCHSAGATIVNQLIYCDNPFCEVIVHRKCYSMKSLPPKSKRWYCDRCKKIRNTPQLQVTCAFCPHTYGGFIRLRKPFFNIHYAHLFCLKLVTGNRFQHDIHTQEYKVSFSRINLSLYAPTCMFCTDSKYASYGAKLTCLKCSNAFHVSCGARRGLCDIGSNNMPIAFCPDHCTATNQLNHLHPGQLSPYDAWVDKRTQYLSTNFKKSPGVFALEAWKQALGQGIFVSHAAYISLYEQFRDAVMDVPADFMDSDYNDWTNSLLRMVRNLYVPAALDDTHLYSVTDEAIAKEYDLADFPDYGNDDSYSLFDRPIEDDEDKYLIAGDKKERKRGRPSTPKKGGSTEKAKAKKGRMARKGRTTKKKNTKAQSNKGRNNIEDNEMDELEEEGDEVSPKKEKKKKRKLSISDKDPATLRCAECGEKDIPTYVLERLHITSQYIVNLENTAHRREEGYTGTGDWWDPRVYVECSGCKTDVHCGCPNPPIKGYPRSRYETFLCMQCDELKDRPTITPEAKESRRKKINYKE